MLFWIILATLTAAVSAVLLYPLLQEGGDSHDSNREEAIYRDQLRELERDKAQGLILEQEAEQARAEIGRRLITAVQHDKPSFFAKANRRWAEFLVVAFLPVMALGLYLQTGHPEMPSQPLQARSSDPEDLETLLVQAQDHLEKEPDDGKGWDILAPIYLKRSQFEEAETAYRHALRLLGASPERLGGLAETLIIQASDTVTPEAQKLLQQSVELEPRNPRAQYYLALAQEQAGNKDQARLGFEAILAQSSADAPWMAIVSEHIVKNGGSLPPRSLTTANADVITGTNAAQRDQAIQAMVASLEAKMASNPQNMEGWMRLIRSYTVLKDQERAQNALHNALKAFPANSMEGQKILALARELGVPRKDQRS